MTKKDPPGIGSFEAGRYPVGFSADVLVGARHDFYMQAGPVCMNFSGAETIRGDFALRYPIRCPFSRECMVRIRAPLPAMLSRIWIRRS